MSYLSSESVAAFEAVAVALEKCGVPRKDQMIWHMGGNVRVLAVPLQRRKDGTFSHYVMFSDPRDDYVLVAGYYYPGRYKHDEKWVDVTSPVTLYSRGRLSKGAIKGAVEYSYEKAIEEHNRRPRRGVHV